MQVLIIGCGDIGQRIALRHMARGDTVTGLVRGSHVAEKLRVLGITPLLAELDHEWSLPSADAVYWCAPPPAFGDDDPRLSRALRRLTTPQLLYISTTGVYGDCQGRWIDETEPLKPKTERGQRRLAAELHLRAWSARTGSKTVTLRVPGIYGPGRLPAQRLQAGTPILRAEESPPTNRIHADDLADAAVCALAEGVAGGAYNVADGAPTSMADYFLRAAALLGLPPPPQLSLPEARAQLSPMLMSFLEEPKRIDPKALKALGWQPRYPDLASGLPHCL